MLKAASIEDSNSTLPSSEGKRTTTVVCSICGAEYAPSRDMWQLKNASPMALEAAFIGMCHFCFRCRRPSCPQCWDVVHGVCGVCVEEARLPFRTELAPLEGVLFPLATPPPPTEERAREAEFVCVRRGRFGEASTGPSPAVSVLQADEATPSAQRKTSDGTEGVSTEQKSFPVLKEREESKSEEEEEEDGPRRRHAGMLHVAERVLTAVVLVVLVVIVVLILAAEFSPVANAQIARVLHIDIRAEIVYVLHLVQLLH